MGVNVQELTFDETSKTFQADGVACRFGSNIESDEIIEMCKKIGGGNNCDSTIINFNETLCARPGTNNTCSAECIVSQINKYYPVWNGTCVPVSCNITEDMRKIYNISSETCSSGDINCGLSTLSCKNEDYNIPSMDKLIYCPSPEKVSSDYLTKDYEIIDYGCALEPPEPTDPTEIRNRLRARQDAALASSQAPNIDQDNIGEEADFTGSTEDMVLDLETGLLEQRLEAELQAENLGGGTGELSEVDMINAASNRLASFGAPP